MIVKKLIIVGMSIVGLLLVALFLLRREDGRIPFHDLNWSYYEEMNEHVSDVELNIPPFFMDRWVDPNWNLEKVFRFFSENENLIWEQPEVPGLTVDSDFEIILQFTNLTGDEGFLNGIEVEDGVLHTRFYVASELAQETLDLLVESEMYSVSGPRVEDKQVPVSEIDWEGLEDNYESLIRGIRIQLHNHPDHHHVDFFGDYDDLPPILNFLSANRHLLYETEDRDKEIDLFLSADYFAIDFILGDPDVLWEDSDREFASFFIPADLYNQLIEAVGEDVWWATAERRLFHFEMNHDQRILVEDIDWEHLERHFDSYIQTIELIVMEERIDFIGDTFDGFPTLLLWFEEHQEFLVNDDNSWDTSVVHIVFQSADNGLENETYADKVAWFHIDSSLTEEFYHFIDDLAWGGNPW